MLRQPLLIAFALLAASSPSAAQESPAYATSAVPARIAASRPLYTGWPRGLTPLPEHFLPLRTERKGSYVVAVSASYVLVARPSWNRQYWIHISNDGGQQWNSYFTGLSGSSPYILFSTSQLPMIGAKSLDIEGEVLRPTAKSPSDFVISIRAPIMVHIPLDTIMADSDGDGLTDMLARHLGFDGSSDAPIVLDSTPAATCGPLSDEQRVLAAAIDVEGWWPHRDWSHPLLIVGDPQRFACIPIRGKVLVYAPSSKNVDRLSPRYIPDFTLNAARDRAEGGGWHAKLVDGKWLVTPPAPPMI